MTNLEIYCCILAVLSSSARCQQGVSVTLPPGTPIPVQLRSHLPMKAGETIHGELMYSVYHDNELVLPAHTVIGGTVVSLKPDHGRRVTARLRADFTPFHTPVVRFDSIIAPDGSQTPIATGEATDGAPIYRVVRTPTPQGGLVGQYFRIALQYLDNTIQAVIGPDKADRFMQFVYSQLPYHPERIQRGTAWTVETTSPLTIAPLTAPPTPPEVRPSRFRLVRTKTLTSDAVDATTGSRPTWILQAYLSDGISSETSKANQAIHATVSEPVLNPDGTVAVPTGAILTGTVTQARPSRHFDRAGVLRFSFSEIKLPETETQQVRTSLAGADTADSKQLEMNSEGEMKPKEQDKILIPALLVLLASRPFDHDHGDHMAGKDATASSGLGLISMIVNAAASQPNLAIGIGMYSAAVSVYPRYIAKGAKVEFPKDTRIVIQTTPTHSVSLKPDAARQ